MADNDISVESVEVALRSEIALRSARTMKDAYLPSPGKTTVDDSCASHPHPADTLGEIEGSGPNAVIYLTKISARTPDEEITRFLREYPDRDVNRRNDDFYTLLLTASLLIGDPSTTRFISAVITVDFPHEITILDYSPKKKGIISGIIETAREGISVSPTLEFSESALQSISVQTDNTENRFRIAVGPEERMNGTYSKKTGYTLNIPACELLEYEGMRKNGHEVYWEIYPPMPPQDIELPGKENLAVFSLVIQVPRNAPPDINVHIDGKLKGNLWGVIPVKGSVILSKKSTVSDDR
jgi:hypothetical protein